MLPSIVSHTRMTELGGEAVKADLVLSQSYIPKKVLQELPISSFDSFSTKYFWNAVQILMAVGFFNAETEVWRPV